jgi:PD-(D/E)XK nuclease superfamily protein
VNPLRTSRRERGITNGFAPTGTISELFVAQDLLAQDYAVFRALANNAPCDLVAVDRRGTTYRIEVKTGRWIESRLAYSTGNPTRYDILAVRVGREVHYFPPLPDSTKPTQQDNASTVTTKPEDCLQP